MKYLVLLLILFGFTSQASAQYMGDLGYPVNTPHECTAGTGWGCPLEIIDKTKWTVGTIAWEKSLYYDKQLSKIQTKVTVTDFDMNTHPTIKDWIAIQLWSESSPEKITIDQLFETSENSGIFEGLITLSNETSNPFQNKLKVNQTDVVFASYYDWTLSENQNSTKIEIISHSKVNLNSKTTFDSPLKQLKSGIAIDGIHCKESLFLIQKYDNTPACVKLKTKQSLIQRGWATELKSVPLKMPTSNSWLGSSGIQVDHIMINETNLALSYNIVGGKLISVSGHGLCSSGVGKIPQTSLFLTLDAKESGILTLFLPRSLIDSKVGENDDNFFVVLDENEITYNETKTDSDRTIAIKFPSSVKEIQVIGYSFCNESFDFTK